MTRWARIIIDSARYRTGDRFRGECGGMDGGMDVKGGAGETRLFSR